MSNYSKTTDFAAKDSLPSGDAAKIIRGSEFETEFDNISTAIATKADSASPTFTGTVTIDGLTVNGNTTLGNAATDTVTVTADIASNLIPSADNTHDLGASGAEWKDLYVDGTAYVDTLDLNGTAVTSTAAELNLLDGATVTTAEINILDGVTATTAEINLLDGVTSTTAELNILDGVTATAAELNTLDGITSTTAELNILDGVTSTASELNLVDGSTAGTVVNSKAVVYGASGEVNATTLQVGGVAITSTPAELNLLDGATVTTAEINILDGVTATTAELNILDGVTSTAAELNILDGVTATATELNILDGVTATTAELNIMDGVTATTAELNLLDGVTATTAELNYVDGVTSAIQTQLDAKAPLASPTFTGTATFATLSDGTINVTAFVDEDNMASNSATLIPTQQSVKAYVDSQVATADALSEVLGNGNTTGGTDIAVGTGDDITFADNSKVIFGAGSDLQIYHDGSNSHIKDAGSGGLRLSTNQFRVYNAATDELSINAVENGTVELYYDNAKKLNTTSTGIDVTGTVTSDGLTASSSSGSVVKLESTSTALGAGAVIGDLQFYSNDATTPGAGVKASITATTVQSLGHDSQLMFSTSNGATNNINRMLIANNGDVSFYEDTGTTAKFYWDASAESLGIGTSSPSAKLSVVGNIASTGVATPEIELVPTGSVGNADIRFNGTTLDIRSNSASASLLLSTASTERMRIDSSGNVGIGTSPSSKLQVMGGTSGLDQISLSSNLTNNTTKYAGIVMTNYGNTTTSLLGGKAENGTTSVYYGSSGSDHRGPQNHIFYTNASATATSGNTERMRINSSGDLLVRCTDLPTGSTSGFGFTADQFYTATTSTSANTQVRFYNGNGLVGNITTDGSATSFNTSSDQRLKDNIVDAPSASDDIDAIQVRSFDWKADGSHQKYGMVAQELQSVAPDAVSGDADSDDMMSIDYSKLVPMLVKEIQTLRARVAQLEGEN